MLKRLFGRQPGGLIHYYGLSEWYSNLSQEQQSKIKYYYSMGMNTNQKNVDTGDVSSSTSSQHFLAYIGLNAVHHNDYDFAEVVLMEAIEAKDDDPVERHFAYNALIEMYYKLRDAKPDAINQCVKYCLKDIEQVDSFIDAWRKRLRNERNTLSTWNDSGLDKDDFIISNDEPGLPRIPSFERLAIIYEKQGDYRSAMELCERAVALGLHDSTKGGFSARLARLGKKKN